MKLWPFVVVLWGLVLAGTVYIWFRDPNPGSSKRVGRELPRLPLDRIEAPLPPRFAGPLPSQVENFAQALEKGPPLSYVQSRLLEGDREMGEKFLSVLRQMAASAQGLEELWSTYGVVLGPGRHNLMGIVPSMPQDDLGYARTFEDEGVPCAWLRERLDEPDEEFPLLRELFWRKLVRCPGAETTALFAREDAPVESVLQHHSAFDRPRFTPALEKAVRRILTQNREELFQEAWRYLSASQEPVARELSEELRRRALGELRAALDQQAASRERARQEKEALPAKCPPVPTRPEGISDLMLSRCLERWAASNWAATARFALSAARSPELQDADPERLATLRNFSSLAEMRGWARERRLLPEGAPNLADEPESFYLSAVMEQAQRAFRIGIADAEFPRRHDALLVTLAWTARPELSGVVFEQLPPKSPVRRWGEKPSSEEYTLRAYADGQRFSVKARNAYSVHDIGAVLGLLNQVLEARGSPHRFAALNTDFWEVPVVFGPEASLREADARGLWRLGDGQEILVQAEAHLWEGTRTMKRDISF
ncbi:hypothetical protein [Hyalangium minutum]|uniref:Uncharacterized protein n=1 Tax=Hyalangium minutum TaxID=394096 RepID=A0A085WLE4_9BACT|nr:hypothetical protein [Hyalangium minutum]KFE68507.1 hypothetical protein DB31_7744 [Hyalangium minutum]